MPPYHSLNLALNTGDNPSNVLKNRNIVCNNFSVLQSQMCLAKQIHGNDAILINQKNKVAIESTEADALITKNKELLIGVLVADCYPLLIADKSGMVIAAVHAGRKGIESGIIQQVLSVFKQKYHIKTSDLLVGVGPGISKTAYQVDKTTAEIFLKKTRYANWDLTQNSVTLDLRAAIHKILHDCDVDHRNIEDIELCTYANPDMFFSYRYNNGLTGRFGAFIML